MSSIEKEKAIENVSQIRLEVVGARAVGKTIFTEALRTYRDAVLKSLNEAPTADVVEVRHGEWEIKSRLYRMLDDYDEEIYVECPFCRRTFFVPYEFDDEKTLAYARENYPYCHCGAKMDGERREE